MKPRFFALFLVLGWLVACRREPEPTPTPSPEPPVVTITKLVSEPIPTEVGSATATLERVATPPPVLTSQPTAIPTETPLPTTTPIPWEIALSDTFLIHNAVLDGLFAVYLSQPEGVGYFLSEGWLIDGHSLSPDGTKLVFDPDGSMLCCRSPKPISTVRSNHRKDDSNATSREAKTGLLVS